MEETQTCFLTCIDNSHDPISLPDNTEIIIGRGPQTKITDRRCSRNQVSLIANINSSVVTVKQLGANNSGVNGMALIRNVSQTVKHGDRLEILLEKYFHCIKFKPPPVVQDQLHTAGIKRQGEEIPSTSKKICESTMEDFLKRNKNDNIDVGTKSCPESIWETIDNGKLLIYTSKNVEGRPKIAAYDIDGTIITTKSGRVFAIDQDDWKIAFTEVPGKLKELWGDGYKIVFITNQAGMTTGKVKPADFKNKVVRIISKLGVPVQVFISTGKGIYRKPAPGMWNALLNEKNNDVAVDMTKSFYCGDAAGREVNWAPKKKKDFSCSDRLMALNVGVTFHTPEEHFLRQRPAPFKLPAFNPSILSAGAMLFEPPDAKITSDKQEVVILVGFPGSGKSFFTSTYMVPANYYHVNRDTLGSWQRCASVMMTALATGKSVVIDNTNPDRESRARFIEKALQHKVACRCFLLQTSLENSKHNNRFREFTDDKHGQVNDIIINAYKIKYEEPSLNEGFSSIIKINFVPKFNKPELEKLYRMFLLEK